MNQISVFIQLINSQIQYKFSMLLTQQIEELRKERKKIRNKSILTDINNQFKKKQDGHFQHCHKTHNFSQLNRQNIERSGSSPAKAVIWPGQSTRNEVTLQDALIYIKHLQKSNSSLRQQLNQNKIYYQNKVSKLESRVKQKNRLLDQCQRQIGHIKKQYLLIDQCKMSCSQERKGSDMIISNSEDSSCQSEKIEKAICQIKRNIEESTYVQPFHGLIRRKN